MFTRKDLLKLIIPLIIEQMLAVTVGLADSMMVSSIGEAAVSGVSLVDSINVLLISLFSALATGGAVVSAQFLGHKDNHRACMAGEQLVASILVLGFLLMSVSLCFGRPILHLMFGEVAPDVMANSKIFLFYTALSFPFLAVYNACAALFRSMGNSKVSMIISFFMNLINIAGNAILIFHFRMGVAGSAIATLVARAVAAAIIYSLLKNKKHAIHFDSVKRFRLQPDMIRRILRIGVPNGLENSVFQIGKIIVQGMIAGLGTSAITANAVANNVGGLGTLPGMAMGLAVLTIVGQCVGAGDYEAVKYYTHKLIKLTYLIMCIGNTAIFFLLPFILKLYHLSNKTTSLADSLLSYHCVLASLIWTLAFCLPNALRAANDVKFTMWTSMISMWLWRIGFTYFLAIYLHIGVLGAWIAMTIDWLFRAICFVIRFHKGKYRTMGMI